MEREKVILRYERFEDSHTWAAILKDKSMAVHIWARKYGEEWYGGVEQHVRPADGEFPDHTVCPFLNGPCRHDGSSLYFEETFKRRAIESITTGDHNGMLRAVEFELWRRIIVNQREVEA